MLHKYYGHESDVWSAGVILYILLCGVPPFWAGKLSNSPFSYNHQLISSFNISLFISVLFSNFRLAETDNGIFRQILKGKIDFESEPWPNISDSAKDLIGKMLDRDPRRRISAHEVLCKLYSCFSYELCLFLFYFYILLNKGNLAFVIGHPWIVDDTVAPDKPLGSAVLSRLKQFCAMNKLKKMALRVCPHLMSFLFICIELVHEEI